MCPLEASLQGTSWGVSFGSLSTRDKLGCVLWKPLYKGQVGGGRVLWKPSSLQGTSWDVSFGSLYKGQVGVCPLEASLKGTSWEWILWKPLYKGQVGSGSSLQGTSWGYVLLKPLYKRQVGGGSVYCSDRRTTDQWLLLGRWERSCPFSKGTTTYRKYFCMTVYACT